MGIFALLQSSPVATCATAAVRGFADDGLGEVAAGHAGAAGCSGAAAPASAQQVRSLSFRFSFAGDRGENFAAVLASTMRTVIATTAFASCLPTPPSAPCVQAAHHGSAVVLVLIVASKLRDVACNDGIHAENVPDLGGR